MYNMDIFLTESGLDYSGLCQIMADYKEYEIYITGEAALYVYLTIAGKSLYWKPKIITIKCHPYRPYRNKMLSFFTQSGYNIDFKFAIGGYLITKPGYIPIELLPTKFGSDKSRLSILNLQWMPDTRFINSDLSILVDAINMRAICYNTSSELIEEYKQRGFKIYSEL